MNRMTIVVAFVVLLRPSAASAQHRDPQPAVPAGIVGAARNAAHRAVGLSLGTSPDRWHLRPDARSGEIVWYLRWDKDHVDMRMDAATGQVLQYSGPGLEALVDATGVTRPLTADSAVELARSLASRFGARRGDWRLSESADVTPQFDSPAWQVRFTEYVRGWPVDAAGLFMVTLERNDHVSWAAEYAQCVMRPGAPACSEPYAREVATRAFRQLVPAAPAEAELQLGGVSWCRLAEGVSQFAPAYRYCFDTPGANGVVKAGVEAVVDAWTGELWRIEYTTEGVPKPVAGRAASPSARIGLAARMLKDRGAAKVGVALVRGTPATVGTPLATASLVHWEDPAGDVELSWAAKERLLAWRTSGGTWSAVKVARQDKASVDAWSAARDKQTNGQ